MIGVIQMSSPNIFVIGMSHVGKTPLSDVLATSMGMTRISASEWVRSRFVPSPGSDSATILADITRFSQAELAKNPDACVSFMENKYGVSKGGFVIEGIRNPRDFMLLFRPERDMVFFLRFPGNTVSPTSFESEGIRVIQENVTWMVNNHLFSRNFMTKCMIAGLREGDVETLLDLPTEGYNLCANLAGAIKYVVGWAKKRVSTDALES